MFVISTKFGKAKIQNFFTKKNNILIFTKKNVEEEVKIQNGGG